jgi:hypothetical protein
VHYLKIGVALAEVATVTYLNWLFIGIRRYLPMAPEAQKKKLIVGIVWLILALTEGVLQAAYPPHNHSGWFGAVACGGLIALAAAFTFHRYKRVAYIRNRRKAAVRWR